MENVLIVGNSERGVDQGVNDTLLNQSRIVSQKTSLIIVSERYIPSVSHFHSQEIRLKNSWTFATIKGAKKWE